MPPARPDHSIYTVVYLTSLLRQHDLAFSPLAKRDGIVTLLEATDNINPPDGDGNRPNQTNNTDPPRTPPRPHAANDQSNPSIGQDDYSLFDEFTNLNAAFECCADYLLRFWILLPLMFAIIIILLYYSARELWQRINTLKTKQVLCLGILYCIFSTGVRTLVWDGAKAGIFICRWEW